MKLVPLADRVLLKPVEAMETTASGIILSTATKEKPVVSEVVAVGPGDKVVVAKYAGTEVKVEDVEYSIVRQSEILAIVE